MSKIDFSNMNTEGSFFNQSTEKKTRKKKEIKSDKKIQIYVTSFEEQELIKKASSQHITVKQLILNNTIYNN